MKKLLALLLCFTCVFSVSQLPIVSADYFPVIYGDANLDKKVNSSDALLTLKCASGKAELDKSSKVRADVDGNEVIDSIDALQILKHSVDKLDFFPVEYIYPDVELPIYQKDQINGAVLEGLFEGNTTYTDLKTRLGGGMHFLDFIKVNGEYYCYYITRYDLQGQSTYAVGLATTTDGLDFYKYGAVFHAESLTDWDWRISSFPGIWYKDGLFYLVYEGAGDSSSPGAVGLAVSVNGIQWKRKGIIVDKSSKSYETVNTGTPDIFNYNGRWFVTYHGFNGTDCQICTAYGNDLMDLKKHPSNPTIPTSADHKAADSGTTGRRDVLYYNGWFYMVYEISGEQPYGTAVWGHKFARSRDMFEWETADPIYPTTGGGMGNDGPCWFVDENGEVFVYFRSSGGSSRYRLTLK